MWLIGRTDGARAAWTNEDLERLRAKERPEKAGRAGCCERKDVVS
jgi:hypothetical protein